MNFTEKCTVLLVATDLSDFLMARLRRLGAVAEATAPAELSEMLTRQMWDLVLVDLGTDDASGIIRRALASGKVRVAYGLESEGRADLIAAAIRAGAADVLSRTVINDRLGEIIEQSSLRRPASIAAWRDALSLDLYGEDPQTLALLGLIRKIAGTQSTVLITGESGTGKELVAACDPQRRAARPKAVGRDQLRRPARARSSSASCSATRAAPSPAPTARATASSSRPTAAPCFSTRSASCRCWRRPSSCASCRSRRSTPLGGNQPISVDVRIVAATNRDLEKLVADGRFRADLFFRLNVVRLEVPPLRARPRDVLPLARLFFARANVRHGGQATCLGLDAEAALLAHRWPGNVRELANVIERAVVLAEAGSISAADLRLTPAPPAATLPLPTAAVATLPVPAIAAPIAATLAAANDNANLNLRAALDLVERRYIEQALQRADGNRTEAAALLGLNRTTLVEKIRKLSAA